MPPRRVASRTPNAVLLLAVTTREANELVESEIADVAGYCHIKFAPLDQATLSWVQPELNRDAEKRIDFYGPCDYDPTGAAEVRTQRAILLRELYGDSSNDQLRIGNGRTEGESFWPSVRIYCKTDGETWP
jgi:hypothetical protein